MTGVITGGLRGGGPSCCLITMIDNATNRRLSLLFEEETTAGAMRVLSLWIRTYGIPQALYCDKKNAFVLTRAPTDAELLSGITEPKSHLGRACEKLGVEVIPATRPPRRRGGWNETTGWIRTAW